MATRNVTFDEVEACELETMSDAARDALPFGVIGIDAEGIARIYNATEARLAGLDRSRVIGEAFFEVIAQCMNNYLVAQRFVDNRVLDVTLPYVLTLRMRPTPVRLRLVASEDTALRFLLIER